MNQKNSLGLNSCFLDLNDPIELFNNWMEAAKKTEINDPYAFSLAMANKKVIMMKGNPITQKNLEKRGVQVHTYDGSEISLKGSGGPTCLSRPFFRNKS